jgi:DNA polymerase-3 subunit epsilon
LEFAILDIETSGGKPKESRIIEIAIIIHDGEKVIDTYETLVNPETKIDWFVQKLTGIKDKDVAESPKFHEVANKIHELLANRVFVAHNISFDYPIVRNEFKRLGLDIRLPHMCTIDSSRILIPGLESYGLKKLSQHLEIDLDNHHRAMDDTLATVRIFEHIYNLDENNLKTFIRDDVNPSDLHPNLDLNFFDDIPNKTGVYRFYNDTKDLIYVGKSTHLKKSVDQHLKNAQSKKAIEMKAKIARIEYDLSGSELIALLIESELIKEHQPKYNKSQKDINLNFGLYNYEDQNGYQNLVVKRVSLTENAIYTFKTQASGKKMLEIWKNEFRLCNRLCNLDDSKSECLNDSIKQCDGACKKEESSVLYNIKVAALTSKIKLDSKSYLILDKGKHKNDYGFVYIENGEYKGYGNMLKFLIHKDPLNFKKQLKQKENNHHFQSIINFQLKNNPKLEILDL